MKKESKALKNFLNQIEIINGHNSNTKSSYKMALNKFSDLTQEEFVSQYMGLKRDQKSVFSEKNLTDKFSSPIDVSSLPTFVDWRLKGLVTPVKDQGQCGSCWIFSAVGALEGAQAKQSGHLVKLSEQEMLDCSIYGQKCNGGNVWNIYDYLDTCMCGIDTEASYTPYMAQVKLKYFLNILLCDFFLFSFP